MVLDKHLSRFPVLLLATSPFQSSTHPQAVFRSKSLPCLQRSCIWENLSQIQACKAQIYIFVEDSPPLAFQRAAMRLNCLFHASHALSLPLSELQTPSQMTDQTSLSLDLKRSQPSKLPRAVMHLKKDLFVTHAPPWCSKRHATPRYTFNPVHKPGHQVRISNPVQSNRPTGSSYPNRSNFINPIHRVRPGSYYFGSTIFNGPWVMAKSWHM
jgi:hypothetical protein